MKTEFWNDHSDLLEVKEQQNIQSNWGRLGSKQPGQVESVSAYSSRTGSRESLPTQTILWTV